MHVQFNSNFLFFFLETLDAPSEVKTDFRYSFLGNFIFIILEKIIKITQLVKFQFQLLLLILS